jgi:hypothetical protein
MNKETNMDATTDLMTQPPRFAGPIVEVEVILPVLFGEQELSLDNAIDRLGEIQDEERILKKEKDPLRKATEATLRANGIDSHSTAGGRSATTYDRTTDQYPDRKYLESILSPEQMALAFPVRDSKGMRVR